jgi:hypothetical protein
MSSAAPRLDLPSFLRRHGARAPQAMWFLGAGASASAGVATAGQMTWDFKRRIFCSEERVPLTALQNVDDPRVRDRIQRHFDPTGHPPLGDPAEYAHYFELAYSSERDRRHYISARVKGAEPSYGHVALAALLAARRARVVWSTNFDPCVETSAARVFGTTAELTVTSLDNPGLAEQALSEERWPLYVKLHGDFQSQRLKNIADELREQDARLRAVLVDACRRYGLIVIGYSGRDASIMEALNESAKPGGYPAGLFWVHRGGSPPLPAVESLVAEAATAGIDAAIVEGETFDEVLADVLHQTSEVPQELMTTVDREAPRLGHAPIPGAGTAWPVVRTNALAVVDFPSTCRSIDCTIGGTKDVRDAVQIAGVAKEVLVARTNAGVLAPTFIRLNPPVSHGSPANTGCLQRRSQ